MGWKDYSIFLKSLIVSLILLIFVSFILSLIPIFTGENYSFCLKEYGSCDSHHFLYILQLDFLGFILYDIMILPILYFILLIYFYLMKKFGNRKIMLGKK